MYFNVHFNVFFKVIKVHLLVSELYIYQNARCNDKKKKNMYSTFKRRPIAENHIHKAKLVSDYSMAHTKTTAVSTRALLLSPYSVACRSTIVASVCCSAATLWHAEPRLCLVHCFPVKFQIQQELD